MGRHQHDPSRLTGGDLESLCRDTLRKVFHRQFDIAIEAVASNGNNFQGDCRTAPQCDRFRKRVAIAVSQFHVQGPGDEREIGSGLADDQSVEVVGIVSRPAKQVGQLQTMNSILFDFESTQNVR